MQPECNITWIIITRNSSKEHNKRYDEKSKQEIYRYGIIRTEIKLDCTKNQNEKVFNNRFVNYVTEMRQFRLMQEG